MTEVDTARPHRGRGGHERPGLLRRVHTRLHANPVTGLITKIVVSIVGAAVVLAGVVLSGPGIPGPGLLVIILGLAILASEWEWAERLMRWAKGKAHRAAERARDMDPAVRRRRILLGALAVLAVVGAVAGYVYVYDWPRFAVSGWDRVQGLVGFVPELPGM